MLAKLGPQIVIVDDRREEVDGLLKVLWEQGLGVKYFSADMMDGHAKPITPLKSVRIIFLDLFYQNAFDRELPAGWVRSIVEKGQFYILVSWTKDSHKHDEVIEELERHGYLPSVHFSLQKTDYRLESAGGFDFEKLAQDVSLKLAEQPAVDQLLTWSLGINDAMNNLLGEICNGPDGILDLRLKQLLIAHGGEGFVKAANTHRRQGVLFDALDLILGNQTSFFRPKNKALDEEITQSVFDITSITQLSPENSSKINGWFAFKRLYQSGELGSGFEPGMIFKANNNLLVNLFGFRQPFNLKQIKDNILSIGNSGNKAGTTTENTDQAVLNDSRLVDVFVLITPSCDIAQDKFGDNLKFIAGVFAGLPKPKGKLPDSMYLIECVSLFDNAGPGCIIFDFRQSFSFPKSKIGKRAISLGLFSKEVLSDIQARYAAYSSRIGISKI